MSVIASQNLLLFSLPNSANYPGQNRSFTLKTGGKICLIMSQSVAVCGILL